MRMNPIVKKDVKVQARSMRISWGVFTYEAIMALVFFFAMFVFQEENRYSNTNIYSSIAMLYPILAITQIVILGVVIPIRTASSISGEKERQTFDIMMTTSMTPFSIILGKVLTALVQSLFFVIAGMPIMALAFVIGGMSWSYLFWFFAISVLVSFFSASIGIFCSSVCKKTISAVSMAYGIYVIFFLLTAIPNLVVNILAYSTNMRSDGTVWFYLVNPSIYLTEFFVWTGSGYSVIYEMFNASGVSKAAVSMEVMHYGWMSASSIAFILVSLFFLWIAARRISPLRGKKRKGTVTVNRQEKQNG